MKEKAKRAYAYDRRSHCRRDWRATIERSIEAKNKSRGGKKRERNGEASFETRGKRRPRELILHIYTTFSKHCLIVHKRRREAGFLVPRSRNNYDWKRSDAKVNFTTALVRLIECLSDVKKKRGKKGKKNKHFLSRDFGILSNSLSLFVVCRDPNTHAFSQRTWICVFAMTSERVSVLSHRKKRNVARGSDRKYSIGWCAHPFRPEKKKKIKLPFFETILVTPLYRD